MLAGELSAQSFVEVDEFAISSADVELFLVVSTDSNKEFLLGYQ